MSLKMFGIYVKGEKIPVMCIQVKTRKTAENCIDEYKAIGRLEGGKDYEVRQFAA